MRKARFVAARGIAAAAASLVFYQPDLVHAQTAPAETPPAPPAAAPRAEPAPAAPRKDSAPAPSEAAKPTKPAEAAPAPPPDGTAPSAPAPAAPASPAPDAPPPQAEPGAEAPATETRSTEVPAATAAPSAEAPGGGLGFGQWPEPGKDAEELRQQGEKRPEQLDQDRVLAEDWWSHTRPTLELHGYFRTRAELFHNFHLGRIDPPNTSMWPRPSDDAYTDLSGQQHGPRVCTGEEAGTSSSSNPAALQGCSGNTQAGANMRFRVEPELVISDNLRVRTQIDFLDNLVLGSTPEGYRNSPGDNGYTVGQRNGYTPVSGDSTTQEPPRSGINSLQDTVTVKRAWAEYSTPLGQARFGRMPDHWGMGMLYNGGDDPDGDYQSTVDRIAFFTAIPSLSLHVGGAWDFANETPTSQSFGLPGEQAYDLGQQDDLSQYNVMVWRRVDPELERLQLAQGSLVVNGGAYVRYQTQQIANDGPGECTSSGANALDCPAGGASEGYARRGLNVWTPDVWLQLKYDKFKFEAEAAAHLGTVESFATQADGNDYSNPNGEDGWDINQWGVASRIRQLLVEDRLELGFDFGWASGDGDVDGLAPGSNGMQDQHGDRTISTFRFNPAYRVDLILNRRILTRIQGTYYFKPSVRYDFIKKATGLRLGGLAEAIWTRASNFMQSPGHERDLGIELDATIYFQSKDGSLNDDPEKMGGFYAALQYGVLFPMAGLGYQGEQRLSNGDTPGDLDTAQTLRLFLGVLY